MAGRTALAATLLLSCSATAAQTAGLPQEPLMTSHPVLTAETLTRVYDYEWFSSGAALDIGADTIFLCEYDGGRLYVTSARFVNTPFPKSYDTRFAVKVTLTKFTPTGETSTVKGNYTYCNRCGRIARETPTITLNGSEDETVNATYGDKLDHRTNARIEEAGNPAFIQVGGTEAFLDGSDEPLDRDSIVSAGRHTLRVVSKQIGNNVFSPSKGKVRVGFAQAERAFSLTVQPLRLTFSEPLAIAPRPADGTARLGRITLPRPDNTPDGGDDPMVAIAEIDSSAVRPEPGEYAVRYRLAARSANYTAGDEWSVTTFTITEGDTTTTPTEPPRPAIPTPDTAPEIFGRPLIGLGSPLGDETLARVYDPDWYAAGGEVETAPPATLTAWGDGTVLIRRAFIGHEGEGAEGGAVRYPATYDEPLPVYASLAFATAAGDTLDIGGRHLYCDACGRVTRATPAITVDGEAEADGRVTTTYGEPLMCRTSARLTRVVNGQTVIVAGGVEPWMDGKRAYNGDLPDAGAHELRVVSMRLGNDNLDPMRGAVEVGFAQAERAFSLTVQPLRLTFSEPLAIAPRPADGTARLGRITLPRPDNTPDGGGDPLIAIAELDSAGVRPEPGEYAVRYRLVARSANYTAGDEWRTTTFTITEGDTTATEPPRPATPSPDTDPDFFAKPLIGHGSPLGDETLARVYDPDWYAKGGEVETAQPATLTAWGDGTVLIRRAFIGHEGEGVEGDAVRYPATYDEPLPVYASLAFATDGGDTLDIGGRHLYCDACGRVTRATPEITVDGEAEADGRVTTTYGEPLMCRTSARLTRVVNGQTVIVAGGVEPWMDGKRAYNGDLPDAGAHELRVVSMRLGNENLDPTRGAVEVGFAQAERAFSLTVQPLRLTFSEPLAIAPRPADGTARLGRITLPRPDNTPDGGDDPMVAIAEIDSSAVLPEPGEYAVRYRLAARSANYTAGDEWSVTTFTITEGDTTQCAEKIVRLKFGNTLIADNGDGEYTSFQWTADGKDIAGATRQYYHADPLPEASYSVRLKRKDGTSASACPLRVGGTKGRLGLKTKGDGTYTVVEVTGAEADGALVVAYTAGGMMVGRANTGRDGKALMRLPLGIVILRATSGERIAEMSIARH